MDKYINCQMCGKRAEKTGRCQKYCKDCAKIANRANSKKSNARYVEKRRMEKRDKEKKQIRVKQTKDNVCKLKDCKYHDYQGVLHGTCNYLSMVGHSRGCPVQGCTKYEPGKRRRKHGNPLSVM